MKKLISIVAVLLFSMGVASASVVGTADEANPAAGDGPMTWCPPVC